MVSPTKAQIEAVAQKIRTTLGATAYIPLPERQRMSLEEPPMKASIWVSRTSFIAPKDEEDGIRHLLSQAITTLGSQEASITVPAACDIDVQWTGFKPSTDAGDLGPALCSEKVKYDSLMKDTRTSMTVFFIYGGALYLNGPSSCRPTVAKLAELTKARCVVTGYRLAPQNPFPAALLDILVAYISLVYPPAGSFHEPIAASSIVIAAESAGASLALSLVQVLLAAKRSQAVDIPTVCFHGSKIPLRCPAGLTCLSTVPTQLPDVFPSFRTKASVDIFSDLVPCLRPDYPPCSIWPSNPPREHYYCEASVICHPLVSPVTARSWKGSPPMWFATGGEERCSDPTKVVAQAAARQGVVVRWEQYEAMPHIWMMLVKNWWQSMMVGRHWAETCQSFATGKELESKGQLIDLGKGELEVDVMTLTDLSPEGAESLMNQRVVSMKPWIGKQDAKASL